MAPCHIDHITITAPSLLAGVEYVREALGVTPQIGGDHPRMGTHNCLLKLGASTFLEVIAVNPKAPSPTQPRWFDLGKLQSTSSPKLATWVIRTTDIKLAVGASPIAVGGIEPMSRGALNWLITIPSDGSLPLQGIAPTLIQWDVGPHPASALQEQGCSLVRLEGFHPEAERITRMLQAIDFQGAFVVSSLPSGMSPHLVAHIQTPTGIHRMPAS